MGTLLISTKNHTFQQDSALLFMGTFVISFKKIVFYPLKIEKYNVDGATDALANNFTDALANKLDVSITNRLFW